jgi:hypothetical protein
MSLPGVNITVLNGALGSVPGTADGIAGMILSGVAVADKIALNEPKQIFSLAEAVALGLDEAYDTANETDVYFQIKQFYSEAGTGAELWIIIVADTVTMAEMADITEVDNAVKLLNSANGTIRLLGISRVPGAAYVATITDGLDADVWSALTKAQALAASYADNMRPVRVVLAGRQWSGVAGDLADLTERTDNRVMVTLCGQASGIEDANIGIVLGRLAAIPVQRKISRVRSGALQLTAAYMTDGATVESHESALGSIHDKGYVIFRKFEGKAGYFFSSDHMATADTDDYKYFARGRVIDKVVLLAYDTFVNEVDEDIEINADGTLPASYLKSLQGDIEKIINTSMVAEGELSSVICTIDPTQNVLSTDKLSVSIQAIPQGYTSTIDIEIGFSNPLNN